MGYIHVEIDSQQISKRTGTPCGDVIGWERTPAHTTLVVSDGLGSGVKANIAATMCVSRVLELLRNGYSLRKAFSSVAQTMNQAMGTDLPYAVFTVVRVLIDGVTSVLSYEMPEPLLVTHKYSNVLKTRTVNMENSLIHEANCHLDPGEGILICSDGISQAGLGSGLPSGWGVDGISRHIQALVTGGYSPREIPDQVVAEAKKLWGRKLGDDCTTALAYCRRGRTVNILTGPPTRRDKDHETVRRFMLMEGSKVVCGGTTAQVVARALGVQVVMEPTPQSLLAPPRSFIENVDLVTEGAVTLNQVYNVLDEDAEAFDEESGVTELHELLKDADRINLLVGSAINPATGDISFRQRGILTRQAIVPLITAKLEKLGKLVVVEYI